MPLPTELAALAEALADPAAAAAVVAARPARGGRQAAVLALFGMHQDQLSVVLVERALHLRHHPGQIAFPGGGVEPADTSAVAAALREGREEIGLDPADVETVGTLPGAHVAVSGYDVTAVVGWWRQPSTPVVDPGEVARVLQVPVPQLVDPQCRVTVRHPTGYRGPAFLIDDPAADEPLMVWGLTAHILDGLLDLAGWAVSWDSSRIAGIPPRFLSDRAAVGGADAH